MELRRFQRRHHRELLCVARCVNSNSNSNSNCDTNCNSNTNSNIDTSYLVKYDRQSGWHGIGVWKSDFHLLCAELKLCHRWRCVERSVVKLQCNDLVSTRDRRRLSGHYQPTDVDILRSG
jgi:hypothetical protein